MLINVIYYQIIYVSTSTLLHKVITSATFARWDSYVCIASCDSIDKRGLKMTDQ